MQIGPVESGVHLLAERPEIESCFMNSRKEQEIETVCTNRKARYEYFILDTLECGIVLTGSEIKSLRNHKASLDGSYATIKNEEVWLIDANIDPYKEASYFQHEPKRKRKLLMHREEIKKFGQKAEQKGHTLVPLKIYFKNGKAKVELAVCRGKKSQDKRQTIKDRDDKKQIKRFKS